MDGHEVPSSFHEMVINVVPKTINGIQTPFVPKTHNLHLSNEKSPGWLVYIGGEILPSYIGIIMGPL